MPRMWMSRSREGNFIHRSLSRIRQLNISLHIQSYWFQTNNKYKLCQKSCHVQSHLHMSSSFHCNVVNRTSWSFRKEEVLNWCLVAGQDVTICHTHDKSQEDRRANAYCIQLFSQWGCWSTQVIVDVRTFVCHNLVYKFHLFNIWYQTLLKALFEAVCRICYCRFATEDFPVQPVGNLVGVTIQLFECIPYA